MRHAAISLAALGELPISRSNTLQSVRAFLRGTRSSSTYLGLAYYARVYPRPRIERGSRRSLEASRASSEQGEPRSIRVLLHVLEEMGARIELEATDESTSTDESTV